jgi:hypothetical protein
VVMGKPYDALVVQSGLTNVVQLLLRSIVSKYCPVNSRNVLLEISLLRGRSKVYTTSYRERSTITTSMRMWKWGVEMHVGDPSFTGSVTSRQLQQTDYGNTAHNHPNILGLIDRSNFSYRFLNFKGSTSHSSLGLRHPNTTIISKYY